MTTFQEKLKNRRTRPAVIMDEDVQVKVYSANEFKELLKKIPKFTEKKMAEFICEQFLDEEGKQMLTPEFILSGECPNCVAVELMAVFRDINSGVYEKN